VKLQTLKPLATTLEADKIYHGLHKGLAATAFFPLIPANLREIKEQFAHAQGLAKIGGFFFDFGKAIKIHQFALYIPKSRAIIRRRPPEWQRRAGSSKGLSSETKRKNDNLKARNIREWQT
jgi:hypothetical protein